MFILRLVLQPYGERRVTFLAYRCTVLSSTAEERRAYTRGRDFDGHRVYYMI